MKNQILILTNSGDRSADSVIKYLAEAKEEFYRFDTETFPSEKRIKLKIGPDGIIGFLAPRQETNKSERLDWENVKSVWHRRPIRPYITEELAPGYVKFIQEEASTALLSLYTTLSAFWINPPLIASRLLQHNKLYQLRVASSLGLTVPDTIITNDAEELLLFCQEKGGVLAVKLLKGNFFTKEGNDVPLFVFTQKVSEDQIRERLDNIRLSPILAEEYVEKKLEFRITIVGKKVFACAIHSQDSEKTRHDWRRYDFANVKHESYVLPKNIEEQLLSLMEFWGLSFGAIDMILTPKNEYVFLELNPGGQWQWIEQATGMPISKAIAELLANPPTPANKISLPT